jgi:hypothetical protein
MPPLKSVLSLVVTFDVCSAKPNAPQGVSPKEVSEALAQCAERRAESEAGAFAASELYFATSPQAFGEYAHPALCVRDAPGALLLLLIKRGRPARGVARAHVGVGRPAPALTDSLL